MAFSSIDKLVSHSIKKSGIKKQVDTAIALERATKIIRRVLGADTESSIRPAYIRYKVLTIACIDSSAAATVGMIDQEILEYVNAGQPYKIVERIGLIT